MRRDNRDFAGRGMHFHNQPPRTRVQPDRDGHALAVDP
jgi:hypothetical protein